MAFSLFAGGGPLANLEIRDRILAVTQSRTIEEMMAKVGARSFQDLARFNDPNYFNAFFVDVQERTPSAPRSLTLTAVYGI